MDLFNWSLNTPQEMTLIECPGYLRLGGMRVFYQPFFILDNGSPLTIGPTSVGFGSMPLGFNGSFRYKSGLNSISALGITIPGWNFQPWAVKESMDITFKSGNYSSTNRIGYEWTARPDNWSYVWVGPALYATSGAAVAFPNLITRLEQAAEYIKEIPSYDNDAG